MTPNALLQTTGVRSGDTILFMADVTRMAWNERRSGRVFTAGALLSDLLQAVGPTGTVLVPTFNHDLQNGDAFDLLRTRSISGALAAAALEHPAFKRTSHPLHSFAVAGAHSQRLASMMNAGSFDADSPFAFLKERSARLIAIDLALDDTLTFVHYVEQHVGVRYRRMGHINIRYTDATGATSLRKLQRYAKRSGYRNTFARLAEPLTRAGAMRVVEAEGSRIAILELALAYTVIADDIRLNNARSIHDFSLRGFLRDVAKSLLHSIGLRTEKERLAHAARTS